MYVVVSSQYFSPVPLSQESGVWMSRRAPGTEGKKKIAFPWAGSRALTSVMMFSVVLTWSTTEMGEIMIVWCSRGGENGERYWVSRYSGAGNLSNRPPTNDKKTQLQWSMFLPSPDWLLHHGNTQTSWLNVFRKTCCCTDTMAYRQTNTSYQLHRESYVRLSISLSVSLSAGYPWCFIVG